MYFVTSHFTEPCIVYCIAGICSWEWLCQLQVSVGDDSVFHVLQWCCWGQVLNCILYFSVLYHIILYFKSYIISYHMISYHIISYHSDILNTKSIKHQINCSWHYLVFYVYLKYLYHSCNKIRFDHYQINTVTCILFSQYCILSNIKGYGRR